MPDERTYGFNRDDAGSLIQSISNEESWYPEFKPRGGQQRLTGILDGDLDPAVAFADDPSSATLSVWVKNSSGDMEDSGNNITVINRMLNISILAGTICEAGWIDGEWRVYAADCDGAS